MPISEKNCNAVEIVGTTGLKKVGKSGLLDLEPFFCWYDRTNERMSYESPYLSPRCLGCIKSSYLARRSPEWCTHDSMRANKWRLQTVRLWSWLLSPRSPCCRVMSSCRWLSFDESKNTWCVGVAHCRPGLLQRKKQKQEGKPMIPLTQLSLLLYLQFLRRTRQHLEIV
jgi:hypothetical protein